MNVSSAKATTNSIPHQRSNRASSPGRVMLNKVPEVSIYFWVIKILATTVGETVADFLNTTLHLGLTGTTAVMSTLLVAVLVVQFRVRRYLPAPYWLAVVLLSVVGTLITDNLTDNLGVTLPSATIAFSLALTATFAAWFATEKTLSIHAITTSRPYQRAYAPAFGVETITKLAGSRFDAKVVTAFLKAFDAGEIQAAPEEQEASGPHALVGA